MAIDLTVRPWNRLKALAVPGLTDQELTAYAEDYEGNSDVYSAAANSWEDALWALPDPEASVPGSVGAVQSASVGDESVTYAVSAASDPVSLNGVLRAQYQAKIRYLRSRSKPTSVLMRQRTTEIYDDRWASYEGSYRDAVFIETYDLGNP